MPTGLTDYNPPQDKKFSFSVDVATVDTSSEYQERFYYITKNKYLLKKIVNDEDNKHKIIDVANGLYGNTKGTFDVVLNQLTSNLGNTSSIGSGGGTGTTSNPSTKVTYSKYVNSTLDTVTIDTHTATATTTGSFLEHGGDLIKDFSQKYTIDTKNISFANSLLIDSKHITLGWYWLSFNNIQDTQDIGLFTFNKLLNDNIGTPYPNHIYYDSTGLVVGDNITPIPLLIPGIYKENGDGLEEYDSNIALRAKISCVPTIYFHDHHIDDKTQNKTIYQEKEGKNVLNYNKHYNSVSIADPVFNKHEWNKMTVTDNYDLRPNVINVKLENDDKIVEDFNTNPQNYLVGSFVIDDDGTENDGFNKCLYYKDKETDRYYRYVPSGHDEIYLNPFGCYLVLLSTQSG